MLVGCLTVFTMLLYAYISCKLREDEDLIKRLVLSQMLFWCTYTLISGILIWIDHFSVRTAIVGTTVIAAVCIILKAQRKQRKKKKKEEILVVYRKYLPILILCVAGAFLLRDKFGLYGLSQDEGVYQTTAISYICSDNSTQKDLPEYELLDEVSQEKFKDKVDELRDAAMHGFYQFDETLKPRDIQTQSSEVSGYYHGVGTYPAQLALWGWIFGIENMLGIQTLFWILAVLLVYVVIDQFQISRWAKVLLTGAYAISPIVLWTGKASLTELFLACLFSFYLYELCKEKNPNAVMTALPIVTFSFFHLSVYSIMPIVCICFLLRFWYRRNETYLLAGMLSTLGYIAGTLYISWSHTEYFYLNVHMLLKLPFASQDNIILIMVILGILGCALFLILWLLSNKLPDKRILPCKWPLRIMTVLLVGIGVYQVVVRISAEDYSGNPSLLSYCLLTGLMLLPLCVILVLRFSSHISKSSQKVSIVLLFLYCVILYSVAFRVETLYHYYGDRYMLPYLASIFVLAAALLEFGWARKRYQITTLICTAIAITYFLPHDIFIVNHQDDTRLQWDTLLEIADQLEAGDILILQDDIMTSCFFPLRNIAGVYCFPVFEEGSYETYEILKSLGKDVYVLSNGSDQGSGIYGRKWRVNCYEYMEDEDTENCDPMAMRQQSIIQIWSLQKMSEY